MSKAQKVDKGRLELAQAELQGAKDWIQIAQERLQELQELGQLPPVYAGNAHEFLMILDALKGANDYISRGVAAVLTITVPVPDAQAEEVDP